VFSLQRPFSDRIRNDTIRERERVGVASIVEKMVENRLGLFGHVERRPIDAIVRRVDEIEEVEEDLEKFYGKLLGLGKI